MDFSGKIVIVTGGAHGIGRCITEHFAAAGARVAVIDRSPEPMDWSAADFYYQGDIAEEHILSVFAGQVIERYGGIDCLVNNACLSRKGILSECSLEDFLYVQKVGVAAPYQLTCLFRDHFRSGAAIVNITSTRASMSQPDTESYSAAKGGISALTHALAVSLAGRVRVNSIAPGWIDTTDGDWSEADKAQHLVKRIGQPQDIARMVLFLCSDDCGFITGENITIDGGMSRQMIYHNDFGWTYNRKL